MSEKVDHQVETADIKSFLSFMWNKKDDTEESEFIGEFLLSYLSEPEEQITFSAYAEFQDTIKYLRNW